MKRKNWVCPYCGTNNSGEVSEKAACFVCGEVTGFTVLNTESDRKTELLREAKKGKKRKERKETGSFGDFFLEMIRRKGEREGEIIGDWKFIASPKEKRKTFIDAEKVLKTEKE